MSPAHSFGWCAAVGIVVAVLIVPHTGVIAVMAIGYVLYLLLGFSNSLSGGSRRGKRKSPRSPRNKTHGRQNHKHGSHGKQGPRFARRR